MWPIGTYKRFLRKIKGQENFGEKVDYFGILFCDARQSKAMEYVLNYLDIVHERSGRFIDFYIPGYIPENDCYSGASNYGIQIGGKRYLFSPKDYLEFCRCFEYDFGVEFPFSATLVLLEYKSGNFSNARKIVFELEASENGIKSAGRLFLNIFTCAESGKMGESLDLLSNSLSTKERIGMIGATTKCILNFFGIDVDPVLDQNQNISKFRVK